MSELLFRSWVDDHYEHNVPVNKNGKYSHCVSTGFERQYDPSYKEYDVEQFTNNHDYYTGEKLFEGDIMERGGKIFVIKFSGCGFVGEQIGKPNLHLSLCLLCHLTSEFKPPGTKIGNIHDNPEFLEV